MSPTCNLLNLGTMESQDRATMDQGRTAQVSRQPHVYRMQNAMLDSCTLEATENEDL